MSQMKNGKSLATNGTSNGDLKDKPEVTKKRVPREIDLMTTDSYTYETLQETANYLLERVSMRPVIGIICGSGIGPVADSVRDKISFPYEDIPNFPISTVEGHIGELVFGYIDNVPVVCMRGRFHYYEGYPLWKCCMPVRVMKLLGVSHLIASNAAGALNDNYKIGDIMLIKDHINIMGLAGNNPLQGPNEERFGQRFPPMNRAYDKDLIQIGKQVGKELGMDAMLHEGVYICLGGPNFETVAEALMWKMLGVNAIGMSTVHEVVTAKHCGMTVFAFSLITNRIVMDYDSEFEPNHEEVMDAGKLAQDKVSKFVSRIVKNIGNNIIKQ